jgi:sulfotransferase
MDKTLHFIVGLPRAGSTMMANLFKQNPDIHGEAVSSLAGLLGAVNANWLSYDQNREYDNPQAKVGVLKGILNGYHSHIEKPIIVDKDRGWVGQIALLESILDRPVKMICMVRNPAEILASFEKLRRNNPQYHSLPDQGLGAGSTIAARAMFYAGPGGALGMAHAQVKDAITMGYKDRLLFVDYNKFCSHPKNQTQRIYDFLELPKFEHNFKKIDQTEHYNDDVVGLKNLHKVKPSIEKSTINCVEYLGLELYQQYDSQIFWDAWV